MGETLIGDLKSAWTLFKTYSFFVQVGKHDGKSFGEDILVLPYAQTEPDLW